MKKHLTTSVSTFKGLYIYDKAFVWKKHPIIHLSLNKIRVPSKNELNKRIKILIFVL